MTRERTKGERCMRGGPWPLLALFCLAISGIGGCKKDAPEAPPRAARRTADDTKPVTVTAKVDKPKCEIGEKFTYTVTVAFDPDYDLDLPAVPEQFENTLLANIDSWHDVKDEGTKKRKEIALTLDPGIGPVVEIPPTTIKFKKRGAAGDWRTATTEGITVEVTSVADKPGEFREPVSPLDLPPAPKKTLEKDRRMLYAAIAAALVAVGAALTVALSRKRAAPIHALSPHEVAQRELAHLVALDLLKKGELREFYFRLTMILRKYIEARFGIMAPERTTEEFLSDMRSSRVLEDAQKKTLAEFMLSADMVKYARFEPPVAEGEKALRIAEEFVMTTLAPDRAPRAEDGSKEAGRAV